MNTMAKKQTKKKPPPKSRNARGEGKQPRYNVQLTADMQTPIATLAALIQLEAGRYISASEATRIAVSEALEARGYELEDVIQ